MDLACLRVDQIDLIRGHIRGAVEVADEGDGAGVVAWLGLGRDSVCGQDQTE